MLLSVLPSHDCKKVGEHKPRMLKEGQSVALRDFRSNAIINWCQTLVNKHLPGSLTYVRTR